MFYGSALEVNNFLQINPFSTLWLAFGLLVVLGIILSFGRRLESATRLERYGIPIALLVGLLGLLLGPYGVVSVLPEDVTAIWDQLPTPLLTLVFATLMIGRPIPNKNGLWHPVAAQALFALLMGFGQYLVGGLIVLFVLLPFLGVDPLMGCLIEVGFEGGHGAAAIMGTSFESLGFKEGLDLGLAMATLGLLSSTLIGSGLIILGRWKGWVKNEKNVDEEPLAQIDLTPDIFKQLSILAVNLGLAGSAILVGLLIRFGLRLIAPFFGGLFEEVVLGFPVFPLALLGSLFIRFLLEKLKITYLVSSLFQREIGILSTDLLIITAMAGLNLPLLVTNWIPLTILAIGGLSWNLAGMFFLPKLLFNKEWFERSITEFGNATGVAASGLLLLRLADPRNQTNTLPIFSIKQLFLQPLLSGGLITVVAPLLIIKLGLIEWTEICGLVTSLLFAIAFLFPTDLETS